ncbi:MAG: hypothetical protein OEZ22_07915 [Spirochaetia bacterium]|nr:hypothetical protein [Spirochaetia bacterium]
MVKKLSLKIPTKLVHKPIVYELITQYKVKPNILEARLEGESTGKIILELEGTEDNMRKSIAYLRELSIEVSELK